MATQTGSYDFTAVKQAYGYADNALTQVESLNDTVAEQGDVLSQTYGMATQISNAFVRWDATTHRLVQVTDPNGDNETITDFLSGWLQFGLDSNNRATLSLGDNSNMTVNLQPNKLSFLQNGNEVAYISDQRLYITQSVVLQQMDVGTKVADSGLGQWSWKVHEVNGANNLYLKWLG